MIKRRTLIIVAMSLLIGVSAPMAGLYWLCYTETGLRWLAGRVTKVGTARIHIDGVQGRLAGPLSAARLEIDQERAHIVASDIRADVKLRNVLLQTIHADYLEIGSIDISVKPRSRAPRKRPLRFMPRWLRLQAPSVAIGSARLVLQNGRILNATGIRAASSVTTDTLTIERAVLASEELELNGSGVLGARAPLQLTGNINWSVHPALRPQWAGRLKLEGDLDRLDVSGRVAEPIVADVAGALSDLTRDWRWEANTSINDFTLKPWSPGSNVSVRTAMLSGRGNRDGFSLNGTLLPLMPETGPLDVSFSGSYADRTLRADEFRVTQKSGKATLDASGTARFAGEATNIDVRAKWRDLAWPLTSAAVMQSPRGEIRLEGQLPYRYAASGELTLPKSPPVRFTSEGELDRRQLRFERLVAQTLGGEVQAEGEWSWAGENAWRVSAQARGLSPAAVDVRFPGRLAFHLAAEGAGFGRDATWSAELRELRGELRSQPVSGRAGVSHESGSYRIASANLRFGDAHLEVSGRYGDGHDLAWQLSVPDAAQLMPEARGSLRSHGTFAGASTEPRLIASLSAQALAYDNYRLGRLEAEADLDLADRRASRLQVSGANLVLRGRAVSSAEIVLDGRASAHQLSILADADNASLSLRTQSGYDEGVWRGQILELDAGVGASALKLTAAAGYAIGKELIGLEQLCLAGTSERVCARGDWRRNGPWSLAVDASGVPLKVLAAGSARAVQYSGVLALQATAKKDAGQPWIGKASGSFAEGVFRYRRASGQMESVQIGSGRASFDATPLRVSGEVHLDAAEAASLHAQARADRTAAADWRRLPLAGSLHAETHELGFVPMLAPEIDRAAGNLTADLELAGTLGAPEIAGALILEEGELDLYAVNLQLREIGMRVDLEGNGLKLVARAHAGKGVAELNGELEWRNRQPHGQIKLKGENLDLVNVPEAHVQVSPDLRFRIDGRRIGVDGAVRVPSAFLTPADLSGAVLASSDEVIVGTEARPYRQGFEVTTGIQLVLGEDVRLDSYGLEARIEGNIAAYAAPDEVSTATGELKVAEGKYSAYTRELDIERGRLIFTGGPLTDPGVDLRASKQFPEALVGVNVRGTLRNPRLSFWSEPSLPQTQIASLIVTGGHLDSFQGRNGTSNQDGGDTLLAQGSALLASQLGQQLGLDLEEVRLESDIDQTRLVLGRYLSPRFYVSYGISLTEAINTLKLRYTINDRWTIRSEAGEHRGADLEYKIER